MDTNEAMYREYVRQIQKFDTTEEDRPPEGLMDAFMNYTALEGAVSLDYQRLLHIKWELARRNILMADALKRMPSEYKAAVGDGAGHDISRVGSDSDEAVFPGTGKIALWSEDFVLALPAAPQSGTDDITLEWDCDDPDAFLEMCLGARMVSGKFAGVALDDLPDIAKCLGKLKTAWDERMTAVYTGLSLALDEMTKEHARQEEPERE